MAKKNFKTWIKDNKDVIIGGALFLIGGAGLSVALSKCFSKKSDLLTALEQIAPETTDTKSISIPDNLIKYVNDIQVCDKGHYADIWYNDIPLSDLGKFGEALSALDGVDPAGSIVGCVASIKINN